MADFDTLNRLTNTLALVALTFALFSGKMMDETWLPEGKLNHGRYYAHLTAWVIMVAAIALHLLMNTRVGGASLLLSMINWQFREKDNPRLWPSHVADWWTQVRSKSWLHWLGLISTLPFLEGLILVF